MGQEKQRPHHRKPRAQQDAEKSRKTCVLVGAIQGHQLLRGQVDGVALNLTFLLSWKPCCVVPRRNLGSSCPRHPCDKAPDLT